MCAPEFLPQFDFDPTVNAFCRTVLALSTIALRIVDFL